MWTWRNKNPRIHLSVNFKINLSFPSFPCKKSMLQGFRIYFAWNPSTSEVAQPIWLDSTRSRLNWLYWGFYSLPFRILYKIYSKPLKSHLFHPAKVLLMCFAILFETLSEHCAVNFKIFFSFFFDLPFETVGTI